MSLPRGKAHVSVAANRRTRRLVFHRSTRRASILQRLQKQLRCWRSRCWVVISKGACRVRSFSTLSLSWLRHNAKLLWQTLCRGTHWARNEMLRALLCFLCVLLGVSSSTALPAALLFHLTPLGVVQVALPPIALGAIAAVVCDRRALHRWRNAHKAQLGERMIRAYSDGVLWMCWWRWRTVGRKRRSTPRGKPRPLKGKDKSR